MTPEVLSNATPVGALRVVEVVHYLQRQHWVAVSHPNPRFLVFENGVDDGGKAIQIVLSSQDTYEDKPYLLTKVVNLLAVLQSMSVQEVVDAIDAERRANLV